MTFTVVPSNSGYFMLPVQAAKYIKLAGAAQLKTLIALYQRMDSPTSDEELAALTGLSVGDVRDALLFWIEKGVAGQGGEEREENSKQKIDKMGNMSENSADSDQNKQENEKKSTAFSHPVGNESHSADSAPAGDASDREEPEKKKLPKIKPNMAQINRRSKEDPEIRELFLQAQAILGRTIGYDTQAQLLMCCDYLGLPVSVVLMICEYARSVKKTGIAYIAHMAEQWSMEGICTFEQANQKIAALEEIRRVWTSFSQQVGLTAPSPSKSQSEKLQKWTQSFRYDTDIIMEAYDEMADHIGKFNMTYMDKTLTAWHEKGLTTLAAIREFREQKTKEKTGGKSKPAEPERETSYDLSGAEKKAGEAAPIYKKKKK